ncbi:MAG: hypothetical protein NC250_01050 [Alistipes senegalensis]|nr:hypothetical protein [Bacteroides cellulosilyticus]MCM1351308.1 hypothetical protein [Alistipes senegalensis]
MDLAFISLALLGGASGNDLSTFTNKGFNSSFIPSVYTTINSSGDPYIFILPYQKSDDQLLDLQKFRTQSRYKALEMSLGKYGQDIPQKGKEQFYSIANLLSSIPFSDNIASFNKEDQSIDIRLMLPFELYLTISRFIDEEDSKNVLFTIHRNGNLLISNELPIDKLVSEFKNLLNDLDKRNA